MWQKKISDMWVAYEKELGVTLTLHDLTGFFRTPQGHPILPVGWHIHRHNICKTLHGERCLAHCLVDVNRKAAKEERPRVHQCWKGVSEITIPIWVDGQHMGTLFAGPFLNRKSMNADTNETKILKKATVGIVPLSPARRKNLLAILDSFSRTLVAYRNSLYDGNMHEGRRELIESIARKQLKEGVDLEKLATALHLSKTRCSHVVKQIFGTSYQKLVLNYRIDKAKSLLTRSELPVYTIAEHCGFTEASHLIRIFKRETGHSPSKYRSQLKLEA